MQSPYYLINYCNEIFYNKRLNLKSIVCKNNILLFEQINLKIKSIIVSRKEVKHRMIMLLYEIRCYKQLNLIVDKQKFNTLLLKYKQYDNFKHITDVVNHIPIFY